ncbi:MAG: ATP-dependent DNA helicase PcrA [Parcubacteria group bacterium GW2011_GWF2_39_13b]|nr:MAG: ATP-dependent DNA helicase PcrA [Parcubacteria group bacterium GW2011_GWF2_39_13b]
MKIVYTKLMDILSSLNEKQREAAQIINGPVLVIAGPGSGKTKVLTHRIAFLIQNKIPPENILAVTFTNKAAGEMKQRIKNLLGKSISKFPAIGTFHSTCAQILRREAPKIGFSSDFIIYDEKDALSLIKKSMEELDISAEKFKPSSIRANISQAKNELILAEDYASQARGYFQDIVGKIYFSYQEKLKQNNAMDFDDLLMLVALLWQNSPETLAKYQNRWQYILVDEYQDTNHTQYALINLLAKKTRNVFAVGDFDQAIYMFRGADFRNILNFEKEYPEARIIILEENYRSTQTILAAAEKIISRNKNRKEKTLWTKNPAGAPITLFEAGSEKEEAVFIVEEIKKKISESQRQFSDFAVLYRTNAQSRAIEEAFLNSAIPYKVIGSVKFYDRREIKDLLAYLKLIQNPNDLISLERIINIPPRGIGKISSNHFASAGKKTPAIELFLSIMDSLRQEKEKLSISALLKSVIKKIKYQDYILNQKDGETRWENIEELFSVTNHYDYLPPKEALKTFLEDASLLQTSDEVETGKNLVNLMTLHCAKGLEFPVVFIAGCEEGIFPHSKSLLDKTQMEEERRLCYVGMTRAKEALYLLSADKRLLYGNITANPPSRFIADLPESLIETQEIIPEKYFDDSGEEKEFKYFY